MSFGPLDHLRHGLPLRAQAEECANEEVKTHGRIRCFHLGDTGLARSHAPGHVLLSQGLLGSQSPETPRER